LKNIVLRSVTGAFFVAILTGAILFQPVTFFALFLLVLVVGLWEFAKLFPEGSKSLFYCGAIISVLTFCLSFFIAWGQIDSRFLALLIPFILWVFIQVLFTQTENPVQIIAYTFLPVIYLAIPLSLLCYLGFLGNEYSGKLLMAMFFLIWTNDTGAFISGITMGKHKMFPRISPKKTWEGTIGGVLLTIAVAYVLSIYWLPMSTLQFVLLAIVVSVFATLGDLTESMFKRAAGVKDSGNILPGHGGILDRFDSMLFVAPAVAFLFYMFEIFSI
jgi:phosphatidate cytidylyltransferase